ncbi:DUF2059 domain-containing protein [Desulfovibrio sp. JC010]|uniref:DUF2059 domain-containing protein n=1 Tax=Desulfovibrio sp. JC010 TaxID=2593641 RepID=UPI0013D19B93|nr:DUF2059 domain-containing protein [Desulfovibrio sp. JC010]NDV28054.1 DUF2059 domain-containing protein [Desulfovibrio sp. JC010]
MKSIKTGIICIMALLCLIAAPAQAEENKKMEVALELAHAMLDTEALYTAFHYMTIMAVEAGVYNDPETEGYREPLINAYKEAFKETFYDPEILDSMYLLHAEVYTEEFNKKELEGLLHFYKTPLGKKFAKKQQIIMQKGEKKAEDLLSSVFANRFDEKLAPKIEKLQNDGIMPTE